MLSCVGMCISISPANSYAASALQHPFLPCTPSLELTNTPLKLFSWPSLHLSLLIYSLFFL